MNLLVSNFVCIAIENMNYNLPTHLPDLPIYKKALEIITLSRSISTYLHQDLNYLKPDGSEDGNIYFTGDIIQQSSNLAPEIINAERERHSEKKYKHLQSLDKITLRLYSNCRRLERSNSNGRDFIPILRSELKKFRRLQRNWMMTL